LLLTATISDQPYTDGLLFTNQVNQQQENTFGTPSTLDKIIQVDLRQPELYITKGVVAFDSDNTDIEFQVADEASTSTPSAPSTANFDATPGSANTFGGNVVSQDFDTPNDNLATNPIDSNLINGLEAGDIVTFAITLENLGQSIRGAFDVTVQDDLPPGFEIPSGATGLNLQVKDGTGAVLPSGITELADNGNGHGLFGDGIRLNDPDDGESPITHTDNEGAIKGYLLNDSGNQTNPGENIAIITYDLQVTADAPFLQAQTQGEGQKYEESIINTATAVYSNSEQGTSFFPIEDTAEVEVDTPRADKFFVSTSEDSTENRDVAIGEVVRYRLVARVPEGVTNNLILRDNLPDGMTFLDDGSARYTFVSNDPTGGITSATPVVTSGTASLPLGLTTTNFDATDQAGSDIDGGDDRLDINEPDEIPIDDAAWQPLPDANIGSRNTTRDNGNGNEDNYVSGRNVFFKLGEITNSDRDADHEFVVVEFNAVVDNDGIVDDNDTPADISDDTTDYNLDGDELRNNVTIFTANSNGGDRRRHDTSGNINVDVVEPDISTVTKLANITSGNNADDTIQYTVEFTNEGNAKAFDINITDDLAENSGLQDLDSLSIVSVVKFTPADPGNPPAIPAAPAVTTTLTPGAGYEISASNSLTNLDIVIDELAPDETITLIYDADLRSTIAPDATITNTAEVTYTSLPGDGTPKSEAGNITSNETGSNTPQIDPTPDTDFYPGVSSGDALGERNGSGTEPNTYTADVSEDIATEGLAAEKIILETSEPSTLDTGDGSSGNPRLLAIGEIVRYRLQVEIPEGTVEDLSIEDILPTGLRYITGTGRVALVADDPAQITSDNFPVGTNPNISLGGNNTDVDTINPTTEITPTVVGNNLTFDLGEIDNVDDDTHDLAADNKEYAIVEFNALVENTAANDAGLTLDNQFAVRASNANDLEPGDLNVVSVGLVEPNITINKFADGIDTTGASDAPEMDSGDSIDYSVTFTNAGANATTAFDVVMTDTLPSFLILDTSPGAITAVDANNTAVGISTANPAANTVEVNVDALPVDETITVNYRAILGDNVNPEQLVTNTANITYTSLPQDAVNAAIAVPELAGSTNTGVSGAVDGERDGTGVNGAEPNDYTNSDDAHVISPPVAPTKTIVATSEASTSEGDTGIDPDLNNPNDPLNPIEPRDVAIGEIVRYRLEVAIPEGTIPNFIIQDTLPAGMRYLNDPGTTKVAFLKNRVDGGGAPETSIFSDAPRILNLPEIDGTQSGDGTEPVRDLHSNQISGAGANGVFDSGEAPIFDLGTITNADRDNDGESVVIEFNAIVENIPNNQDGRIDNPIGTRTELVNRFTVTSGITVAELINGDSPDTIQTSNDAIVEVLEPEIVNVTQTVTPTDGDAEDTITFSVTFSNTGSTSAFEVSVTDDLATDKLNNLSNIRILRNGVAIAASEFDNNSTATNLDLSIHEIEVRDRIEVLYDADLIDTISPNLTIDTTANVTYSSLPGTGTPLVDENGDPTNNTTGSTTPGASGADNGERNGDDGAPDPDPTTPLNNYADSDDASLTTPGLTPTKSIVATSETSTSEAGDGTDVNPRIVTIGEVVRYRLSIDLPEGQIDNLKVEDVLPTGLKYLHDGSARVALVADNQADISFVDTATNPPAIANPNGDLSVRIEGNQTNIANITPTKTITAQNAAGDVFDSDNDTNPVFNLGSILNNDDEALADNNKEYAVIEFNAIVENIAANQSGVTLENNFTITYDTNQSVTTTDSIDVEIVEP
ncbi:MAG: hypothetical protein AAFO95_13515, partial [Cyanobacteria bacterium J06600_6]